jgi:hypothetical protein
MEADITAIAAIEVAKCATIRAPSFVSNCSRLEAQDEQSNSKMGEDRSSKQQRCRIAVFP